MSFVAAAIGGSSALSMGGSIFGGLMGSSAEKKRAAAIAQAGNQGADSILAAIKSANTQASDYNHMAREDLSPFRNYGVQAGNTLASLLMGGGNVQQALKASPLFNFQSQLGTQQLNQQLAARGLYGSGAGLQTLAQFNNQLVGNEGQNLFDRLFSLTQLGAGSAGQMAGLTNQTGLQTAQNILSGSTDAANLRFNALTGAAQARSNATQMLGQMGQSLFDTAAGGINQGINYSLYQPLLNGLSGGGGGIGAGSQKTTAPEDIAFNYGGMTQGSGGYLPFSMTGG